MYKTKVNINTFIIFKARMNANVFLSSTNDNRDKTE